MADIQIKSNEQLHAVMDKVNRWVDEGESKLRDVDTELKAVRESGDAITAEMRELRETVAGSVENMKDIQERLDNLDKQLPYGEKVYRAIVPAQDSRSKEIRENFARGVLDLALISRGVRPRFQGVTDRANTINVENVDADGGYLVPDEQRAEIVRIIQRYGVARRLCRVLPMSSQELRIPTNTLLPDVYWDTQIDGSGGAPSNTVHGITGSGTPSDKELYAPEAKKVTVDRPALVAHKLIGINIMSLELAEDSVPPMADLVMDLFATAMAKAEDYQAFVSPGTGTNPFTGLLFTSSIPSASGAANTFLSSLTATGATGGYNLLISTMDAADEDVAENGTWLMSNSILNAIRKVKDINDRPLIEEINQGTLFGRPFVRSRVMPKTSDGSQAEKPFIAFGDFSFHLMGDRRAMTIDVSKDAAFREAGLVMRIMERVAFVNAIKEAFAVAKASA